jgi:hypothetical protein
METLYLNQINKKITTKNNNYQSRPQTKILVRILKEKVPKINNFSKKL